MRIPRLFIADSLAAGRTLDLTGESAHYIGTVLRLRAGALVAPFNGDDGEFLAEVVDVAKKRTTLQMRGAVDNSADPVLPVHTAVGLSRGDRMDILIQKATELGVSRVTPLFTERCEVKLDERRAAKRQAHWQKVAVSATEQSGRCRVPTIDPPVALTQWLPGDTNACRLVLDPRTGSRLTLPANHGLRPVTVLSGPEGGLTDEEVQLACQHDFQPITLGPRVLRTETAPLAALSLLQYLAGDI